MKQSQNISDEHNNVTGGIIPIDIWKELQSEMETAYLLKNENMKQHLMAVKNRMEGIPFDEACEKLGV